MRRVVLLTLVLLAAGATAALAQSCPRTSVADLEDEVMCPVCGTSLALAREAPLAQRERAMIERLVRRCRSKSEIKTALVAQFGPAVLAEPPNDGLWSAVVGVPVAGGLLAILGAALLVRRWRRRGAEEDEPGPGHVTSADDLVLEAELERLR